LEGQKKGACGRKEIKTRGKDSRSRGKRKSRIVRCAGTQEAACWGGNDWKKPTNQLPKVRPIFPQIRRGVKKCGNPSWKGRQGGKNEKDRGPNNMVWEKERRIVAT